MNKKPKNLSEIQQNFSPAVENFGNSTNQKGIELGSNSTARTNNLCADGKVLVGSFEWSEERFQAIRAYSNEVAYLFLFQFETGCRVSEALKISYTQILSNGDVLIKADKKSEDRVISAGRCAKWLISCKKARCNPFMNFNRFFIHRTYKKFGIVFESKNSTKLSTTHALRHLKANSLRNENIDNELIGKALGHKNKKNTELYGKQK